MPVQLSRPAYSGRDSSVIAVMRQGFLQTLLEQPLLLHPRQHPAQHLVINVGGDELHRAVAEKQDVVGGKARQLAQLLRAEAERFAVADLPLLQRLDDVGEHRLVN